MKKFLSLVLALVMTMSLVTVSAGAKDFGDSDELSGEQYEEAVNVMSEMGIIDGYADGDFRPQGTLTRQAAAKIIACMMLGKTTAESLGTSAAPFKDVPAGSSFAGYIAFCVERGLISGYGDGTFRPTGTLTGFAFLKMLLGALGYDQSIEGYTGTNWTVNVMSRATQIGLTDGDDAFVGSRALTREEACLFAVNTLKATLVEYADKGQEITVNNGTVITVRPSAPTYVTSSISGAATSIDDTWDNTTHDYTVEFAEKYQPDLELERTTDAFGRPAHIWTWKNDEIGTYVDYDKLTAEYTTKVTGRDLYDAIGSAALDRCDVTIYVDGETSRSVLGNAYFTENQIARSYTDTVGETGNGVLTQVFEDTRNDEITIAIINTYLAKADEDYDERNDDVDLTVYKINEANDIYMKTDAEEETMTVEGEDFAIEDVTEDQLFLVTVADGEIQTMADPEILSEVSLSNFKRTSYVTADSTQYDYADTAMYDEDVLDMYDDSNMKDVTYNLILDPYGYMIGIELNEAPDQYLFLTGIDLGSSNLSKRNADANVIFTNGEMDTITVDMRDSVMSEVVVNRDGKYDVETDDLANLTTNVKNTSGKTRAQLNTWCTYTVDANGVYTLEQVADMTFTKDDAADRAVKVAQSVNTLTGSDTMTIDQRNVALNGYGSTKVYGNDDTIYLVVDPTDDMENITDKDDNNVRIIDDVTSVAVGVKNVKLSVENLGAVSAGGKTYQAPDSEVYTLYDDDGYVIAAVVLGEDEGVTTNYAYVTSDDVNREALTGDEWTWTREAVVNGQIVELSEVGSSLRHLDDMDQGKWYEVKYDADGNVRSAKEIVFDADGANNGDAGMGNNKNRNEDEFAIDVKELNESASGTTENLMEAHDTVVLADINTVTKLTFRNGTLYTDTAATEGFAVSANVNVVLALAGRNGDGRGTDWFDEVEDGYTGYSGLQKAIRDMNVNNDNGFTAGYVEVHAIIEDGAATSIIINDKTTSGRYTNAAGITVTVNQSSASVTEGDDVTFTANVTVEPGRTAGTLSYQWYKDADGDNVADRGEEIRGATDSTYTLEDVDSTDNGTYICVVTNTDTRSEITGSTTSTASNSATLTVGATQIDVLVTFVDSADTDVVIDEFRTTVDDQGAFITVNGSDMLAEAAEDNASLNNYVIVGRTSQTKEPSANGSVMFEFQVALKSATLNITLGGAISSYTLIGDAQRTITIGDPIEIIVQRSTAGNYTGFDNYNWSISGTGITPAATQAVLTDDGSDGGKAQITFYATIDSFEDGTTYNVTVSAESK